MAKAALVEQDIHLGETAVRRLDAAGVIVPAAFWLYLSDAEIWRLVLATPLVDELGPQGAYRRVGDVLLGTEPAVDLSIDDIAVASPNSETVVLLGLATSTGSEIGRIRFSRNVVNGVFIEDAYIYRLSTQAQPARAS